MASKKSKTIQQMASLRLKTKPPVTFKDRRKERDRKACRGKVEQCSKDSTY